MRPKRVGGMAAPGTFEIFRDVCSSLAVSGKADLGYVPRLVDLLVRVVGECSPPRRRTSARTSSRRLGRRAGWRDRVGPMPTITAGVEQSAKTQKRSAFFRVGPVNRHRPWMKPQDH